MRELSLHILDLVQNSITANSNLIKVHIEENTSENLFKIIIEDDGKGMEKEFLEKVRSPFTTSRDTRDIGLGIPLFEAACDRCGGGIEIWSEVGEGTKLVGTMERNNIDRPPLGRINETISSLLLFDNVDIEYIHKVNENEFVFKSTEIKEIVGEDINSPSIIKWINEYIIENLQGIGVDIWS
ncbi:ATP-binding protein [Oceanirhabdus sp. W0125-5]|uniref:ATP-binding protein n=1 Tax=Oceanirhabdus sp. W0125-5 TaxID=2999116 RepID=UPI0022F34653|nr:ATP-binding protein [Oceanirhabdus sp. W0125-5]WBW95741.1 ATP-binding protein [Oceanirhabdus sp. W0125-5]